MIDIPPEVETMLKLYNIPWPDVDEDAFDHMRQPLRDFGQSLEAVTEDIDSGLRLLESGNPSQTLAAVVHYLAAIRNDVMNPVNQVCDDLAGWPCDTTYQAIRDLKVALLTMLAGEVIDDAIDLVFTVATLGADAPLAMAQAAMVSEMVSLAIQAAEREISSLLQNAADTQIDGFVSSIVNPFIDQMSGLVEGRVSSYAPHLALQTAFLTEQASPGSGASQGLRLSPQDLEQCVESISKSSEHLYSAISRLEGAIEEIFSHPAPNTPPIPSITSVLRTTLESVMNTVKGDLFDGVKKLIERVVQHFITLLQDYKKALEELDAQAKDAASKQHALPGPAIFVAPAAGVAAVAGGGVLRSSGVVNSEEADQVQVESAVAVNSTNPLAVAAARAPVTPAEPATATDLTVDVHVRTDAPTVKVDVVTSTGQNVETVHVTADHEGPHAGLAQGATPAVATVSTHGSGEHAHHVAEPVGASPGVQSHLHVKHPGGHRPKAESAEQEAHLVKEANAKANEQKKPIVDTSAVVTEGP